MKLLVHGSGFARPFRTDPEELRCGKPREVRGNPLCHWSPATVDWEALGRSSGGSNGVADVSGLLALIRAQARDSIEELRIIGHSNGAFLALGGRVKLDQVEFDEATMIGDSKSFGTLRSAFRTLQDRFRADGKVVLAGCGSGGVGSDLLDFASHSFLRTVAGFREPILYAIDGTTRGPIVNDRTGKPIGRRIDDDARITVRGKAMYSRAANRIEDVLGSDFVGTSVLQTNAWLLMPDASSSAGDIFVEVDRCKKNPGVIAAAALGYKLLRVFETYRMHGVAGVGFDASYAGLRVKEDPKMKGKITIDIGKGYVDRITPATLEQRLKELWEAVERTLRKQPGDVPVR